MCSGHVDGVGLEGAGGVGASTSSAAGKALLAPAGTACCMHKGQQQLRSRIRKSTVSPTRQQCMPDTRMLAIVMPQVALCQECGWRRIQRPDYLCCWVDLKQHFRAKYKKAGNLRSCVEKAGRAVQPRCALHHSSLPAVFCCQYARRAQVQHPLVSLWSQHCCLAVTCV